MLTELAVTDLGVIADVSLVLGPGMTALTGETGAGKTLLVTAIELLVGGRADSAVVRPGAKEARVDGRFEDAGGNEVVLSRVVPADGRSRAYVDGRPAPVSALAELGAELVDLHGQHAHQSLLAPATQRAALDAFGGIDLGPLHAARAEVARLDTALVALGGDPRARARELDLVRFQVEELDAAGIDEPDEEDGLRRQESLLADAEAARAAGAAAHDALLDEGGAADAVNIALAALTDRPAFTELAERLRSLAAELADAGAEARDLGEAVEEDPERLAEVQARRSLLRDLRRKYGETLADVLAFASDARARLAELESHDARAAALDAERSAAVAAVEAAAAVVAKARRKAAPKLAAEVEVRLRELAMPRAEVRVEVDGPGPADEVRFLLAANPGEATLPLAKVASGGELARAMLALRLALMSQHGGHDGRTLVFDEVDAGIGGEAALAVGRSLADLGTEGQVLVVTHLPQVAAFADHQVAVAKLEAGGRTTSSARALDDAERVVELSRMLSGQPESAAARGHAEELLAVARQRSGR
ncbi:MAG: recN [Actinomycetia bacterium]|nr:recN [Actinomycetes bacterium]